MMPCRQAGHPLFRQPARHPPPWSQALGASRCRTAHAPPVGGGDAQAARGTRAVPAAGTGRGAGPSRRLPTPPQRLPRRRCLEQRIGAQRFPGLGTMRLVRRFATCADPCHSLAGGVISHVRLFTERRVRVREHRRLHRGVGPRDGQAPQGPQVPGPGPRTPRPLRCVCAKTPPPGLCAAHAGDRGRGGMRLTHARRFARRRGRDGGGGGGCGVHRQRAT